jgi:hypothetical protein
MPLYFGAAFIGRVPPPCSILGVLVYAITDFSSSPYLLSNSVAAEMPVRV